MNRALFVSILAVLLVSFVTAGGAAKEESGEELFKEHCAVCHPDGGNIVNPKYTLHKKDLKGHNITKPSDIVRNMRNPGPA